ncbi:MAG: hypothetical protein Q9165_000941 [Trypethelium subeluteriae]
MAFTLTPEYILHLLNEAAAANPGPFLEALDHKVRWRIGSEVKDDIAKTGVYVIGNKAYVEFNSEGTQNNGKPYNNHYFWVLIFDGNGKATEIREYLDTGLVREVFSNN